MYIKNLISGASLLSSFLFSGCESIGPKGIKSAHGDYNSAIAVTADEQQLLNIVRLKYRDSINFIEVSNIVENRKFTTRFGGTKIGVGKHAGKTELSPLVHAELFQNPTITYEPLRGKEFTERMIAPIPVSVVFGLMQAGWNAECVFNLCIEEINGIENAPTASGPTPQEKPIFESFERLSSLIGELCTQKKIIFGLDDTQEQNVIMSLDTIETSATQQANQSNIKSLLGLDKNQDTFMVTSNYTSSSTKDVNIRTRSMQEIMFFLSHSVHTPTEDITEGIVTTTVDQNGEVFDWNNNLAGKWLKIQCSTETKRPTNAYIAVKYRNKWFYIADNDLKSKSTFMFVRNLFNLQSGNAYAAAPSLTIAAN